MMQPDIPTLLIVDDTLSNLRVLVTLFEESGYRVAVAQDGEEGLRRAVLVQPDLILLDVMLPGTDGFDVCRQLKAEEATRDIPVIFMTSLASVEHKLKGFQAGGVDYITKPLQFEEVMARVGTQLKLGIMRKKLEAQNAELQRYREQLEMRVAERTAELNESNQRLRAEIAEREKAQQDLAAREREFRTLAENAPDNIARYDRRCRFVYLNPPLAATLKMSPRDILGRSASEIHGGMPAAVEYDARMMAVMETGLPDEIETFLPDTGEGVRYHQVRFVAERDAKGNIVGVLAIGRDVTEHRRLEEELRTREQYQRALLDNFPFMVWLKDTESRLLAINRPYRDTAGMSPDAPYFGKSDLDLFPRELAEKFWADDREVMASGQQKTVEERVGVAGNIRWHETWKSPVFDQDGRLLGTVGFARDITGRRETERLLHERDQAIRAVVENSPDAIARYDSRLRRVYVNPATQKLYGLPPDEILGKTFEDLPPLPEDFIPILRSVFDGGQEVRAELPFRKPDGTTGWGDLRIVPEFGPDGRVATVLSIGRDITERKQMENLLREERGLFVGGPTVVFKWKAEEGWPVEYVSPNVREQFGYSPVDFTGGAVIFAAIVHPDDLARVGAEVTLYTAQGRTSYEQVYRIAHGMGGYRWIYDFTIVTRKEDGTVAHYHGYVMDVTERKLAENALKESEQRYRQIFDNVSDALYLLEVTPEGRFRNLAVNPAFEASSGIPRRDLIGKFIEETVPMATAAIVSAKYRCCIESGAPLEEEVALDLPSGRRHFHSTLIPVRDETGRIHRIVGISRDITDRERARELVLRQAELDRRLARFAELAPGFMFSFRQGGDGGDVFLYASPGIETLCGLRVEQVLDDAAMFFERMPPIEQARIFAAMADAARSARTCVIEYAASHPLSGEQWLELRATPEIEPGGGVLWHGHLVDVTARRAMERENALLRAMADNAVDPLIFTHSLDIADGLRLLYFNPAFARHLGYDAEEMRGIGVGDFTCFALDELAGHMDILRREKSLRFETEHVRKNGERVPVEVTLSHLEHNGEQLAAGYCMDITLRKEAERRLEESRAQLRELAARSEAVRDQERKHIAREMHDELGQGLTALKLEIALLPFQFGQELAEKAEVLTERVEKTIRLVRNMISMLRPPALDMGIVAALDWLVAEFGGYSGIHCSLPGSEEDIELDDARAILVFRIAQEFLTNVVRHAGAHNVYISLEKADDGYVLMAQDDGKGFDPSTIRKKTFGLLGMRERAIMLDGSLEIFSAPGLGTRLELKFPGEGGVKHGLDE